MSEKTIKFIIAKIVEDFSQFKIDNDLEDEDCADIFISKYRLRPNTRIRKIPEDSERCPSLTSKQERCKNKKLKNQEVCLVHHKQKKKDHVESFEHKQKNKKYSTVKHVTDRDSDLDL